MASSEVKKVARAAKLCVAAAVLVATIPLYAISFVLAGQEQMWISSSSIYNIIAEGRYPYLFNHLGRKIGIQNLFYKYHPFCGGAAMVATSLMLWQLPSINDDQGMMPSNALLLSMITSVLACCGLSYCGGKLVPTMYGNASMKRWTRVQQHLTAFYSLMILALILLLPWWSNTASRILHLVCTLIWSLLFCAGALQRVYVLCVLPLLKNLDVEKAYVDVYSLQSMLPMGLLLYYWM